MTWESLTDQQRSALWAEQDELEISSVEQGIRRYREQCQRGTMASHPAAHQLMLKSLEEVVHGIEIARIAVQQGRGLKGAQGWGLPFLVMDPGVLGLAAIAATLDMFSCAGDDGPTLNYAIARIGDRVEMEWHFMLLKQEMPKLKAMLDRRVKTWNPQALRRARKKMGDLGERWDLKSKRLVGAKLAEIVVERSGLFEVKKRWTGPNRTVLGIRLTPPAIELIDKINEVLELLHPVLLPMVVPPLDWSPEERGGYHILRQYGGMVSTRADAPDSPQDHGPLVYQAINALQRTSARKIHTRVLKAAKTLWAYGGGRAGIPLANPAPLPGPYPEDGTPEQQTKWKQEASLIHAANARAESHRIAFLSTMAIAERFARYDTIWFPHKLDFRGRGYPQATHLHPQGGDLARGLLTYPVGKPLGEKGLDWLMVQYAGCWGVDKVNFESRLAWAQNKLQGLGKGTLEPDWDPMDVVHLWEPAKKPWQALAALCDILDARLSPDPTKFLSTARVCRDGTNSGKQHLSAMIRDLDGAKLVNLAPSDSPNDSYAIVASVVIDLLNDISESGVEDQKTLARAWLKSGITRDTCKRADMTYVYGVTLQGVINALIADGHCDWAETSVGKFQAATFLGPIIWKAIEICSPSAKKVMDWFKLCAGCANKAGVLLSWRSPVGFHVLHPYQEADTVRVSCMSSEVTFRVRASEPKIMPYRQRQAAPPNITHSFDAAHWMLVLCSLDDYGITHLDMVHDDYGTHAADVDKLDELLRVKFVELYSTDVLEDIRSQVVALTGHDPGPPPERGEFNLSDVLNSPYAFN